MRALLFLLLLFAPLPACAQQTDEQFWLQTNAGIALNDHTRLTLEGITRFSDRAGGFFHYEIGGMIGVTVASGVEIAGGYRHVQDYDHGALKPNEERVREQVTVQLGGGFSTRLRFEQRFQASGGETGLRFRPSLRYTLPLGSKGLALFASHEDFINLNTTGWGQRGGYERMRNAVGLTIPLSPKLKGDMGYLNQYRLRQSGARDQMDHAATFALTLSL